MAQKKILAVDDDPDIRALIETYLRGEGYAVVLGEDGFSCVAKAQREQPDLILLDLGLPAGDGMTVLQRLKRNSQLSHVPVLVVTAREAREWKEAAIESEASGYLQKPIDKQELLDAVRSCLGGPALPNRASGDACPSCGRKGGEDSGSVSVEVAERIAVEVAHAVLREVASR